MIILSTLSSDTTFYIIPTQVSKVGNSIILEFTNETTKEVFLILASIVTTTNDITSIYIEELQFLKDNTFFNLRLYFNITGETIYKDRVFATNQTQGTFSINNGQYITPTIDNNSYITI